jgi:Uncharacterized protein, possibly involved in utilization of glycolate and propanediol
LVCGFLQLLHDRLGNFCQSVAVLTLSLATLMTEAAVARAAQLGALVSAATVDAGGHLVHFQRMDRAEIAGPTLAVDKAYTAVAHRAATADLTALAAPGGPLAGLQANGGGRYVIFGGGLPCWSGDPRDGGVVVGGIGVSGGTTEQDVACAEAGLAVFRTAASATG